MKGHYFKRSDLIEILDLALNKSLGELDSKRILNKAINNNKITGIAGDIIEQSVLGLPPDIKQRPDLDVEGLAVELKTTGIKLTQKNKRFVAKEPMTITAVSPHNIVNEEFLSSAFWHKTRNMLIVYYHYDSYVPVPALQYSEFILKGYEFHKFSKQDKKRFENDWILVRDFLRALQKQYQKPTEQYHRLSSELRGKLLYIDTAPKWPNIPRFRIKRHVVTSIVQNYFGEYLEELPRSYTSLEQIDQKFHSLTLKYKGKSVEELLIIFGITHKISKSISEQIVVKMFGGESKKMKKIELFNKVAFIGRTIILNSKGYKTEDMKLLAIDFTEWLDDSIEFEESMIYDFFSNYKFICIIFKENMNGSHLKDNVFIGFKRIVFDDGFIQSEVRKIWENIRELLNNNKLTETILLNKYNQPIINKAGTFKTKLNFPKAKDNLIFVRGTGTNSIRKTKEINGIKLYNQDIWIKGSYIVELLNDLPFL